MPLQGLDRAPFNCVTLTASKPEAPDIDPVYTEFLWWAKFWKARDVFCKRLPGFQLFLKNWNIGPGMRSEQCLTPFDKGQGCSTEEETDHPIKKMTNNPISEQNKIDKGHISQRRGSTSVVSREI